MRPFGGSVPAGNERKPWMASSRIGLEMFMGKVRQAFPRLCKKEAEEMVRGIFAALEATLVENLDVDRFAIKLFKFGKLIVRHRRAGLRRIPLTGEVKLTGGRRKVKFTTLGILRRLEKASAPNVPKDQKENQK
jgi:nucleoid DNA-binding protein